MLAAHQRGGRGDRPVEGDGRRARVARRPPTDVRIIPMGTDMEPPPTRRARRDARSGSKIERPYVLWMGTLEPRKNPEGVVRGFVHAIESGVPRRGQAEPLPRRSAGLVERRRARADRREGSRRSRPADRRAAGRRSARRCTPRRRRSSSRRSPRVRPPGARSDGVRGAGRHVEPVVPARGRRIRSRALRPDRPRLDRQRDRQGAARHRPRRRPAPARLAPGEGLQLGAHRAADGRAVPRGARTPSRHGCPHAARHEGRRRRDGDPGLRGWASAVYVIELLARAGSVR